MIRTLYYPRRNVIGIEPVWEPRRLKEIERIDLVETPLPISDYLRRPLIRRGRWLIRAYDIDLKKYRQFYECAFKHNFREPPLRIGQFFEGRIVPLGRAYKPTVKERRRLAMTLHRLKKLNRLFVYADDLAIRAA